VKLPDSRSWFRNSLRLIGLFRVDPVAGANVVLHWKGRTYETVTEDDGFIKFEWEQDGDLPAGRHDVTVTHENDGKIISCEAELVVPHITQFAFISDVDDTVMKSYSATTFRRLRALLSNTPSSRKVFDDVATFYQQLSQAHTESDSPNPFFYVSSSEWNLYDYLHRVFDLKKLPRGVFLLNQIKQWQELWKTGKTRHEGKLARIVRILHTFPNQRLVLIGDNTQQDPVIYESLARKYPDRIHAILIRRVVEENAAETAERLKSLTKDLPVYTCQFHNTDEAMLFCKEAGLLPAS